MHDALRKATQKPHLGFRHDLLSWILDPIRLGSAVGHRPGPGSRLNLAGSGSGSRLGLDPNLGPVHASHR